MQFQGGFKGAVLNGRRNADSLCGSESSGKNKKYKKDSKNLKADESSNGGAGGSTCSGGGKTNTPGKDLAKVT